MEQTNLVFGFSDFKDLLIRTYKIEEDRDQVKLYFTQVKDQIYLHDYHDHQRSIRIVASVRGKRIEQGISPRSYSVCQVALESNHPVKFLNEGFQLYGFFKS